MKITVCVVHNENVERNKIVDSSLTATKDALESSGFTVETRWIGFQSSPPAKFTAKLLRSAASREIFLARLLFLRKRRFGYGLRAVHRISISGLRFLLRRPPRLDDFRRSWINEKHYRAWCAILDSGSDYGIILEDDAFPRPDSSRRLSQEIAPLLTLLSSEEANTPVLIELAGDGSEHAAYSDQRAVAAVGETKIELSRYQSTNLIKSGAAYILNKHLTEWLVSTTTNGEMPLLMPSLHLNISLGRIAKEGDAPIVIFISPPVYTHGSQLPDFLSWRD